MSEKNPTVTRERLGFVWIVRAADSFADDLDIFESEDDARAYAQARGWDEPIEEPIFFADDDVTRDYIEEAGRNA